MTSSAPRVIGIDSCVAIDMHQRTEKYIKDLGRIEAEMEAGRLEVVISTLTIGECTRLTADKAADAKNADDEVVAIIRRYFSKQGFRVTAVTRGISERVQRLRRQVDSFRGNDPFIVATALEHDVEYFITRDGDEAKPRPSKILANNGRFMRDGGDPLRIITPAAFWPAFEGLTLLTKGPGAAAPSPAGPAAEAP